MDSKNDQLVVIKIVRVFKCKKESTFLFRKNVYRDEKHVMRCNSCHEEVQEVTNTETGRSLIQVLAL